MGIIRFRGFFEHVLDDRNRLAIPSQFRHVLNKESESKVILTPGYDREIAVYALKTWEIIEEQELLTLSMDRVQARRYRRHFTFGIKEDHLDNQGRILLPGFLLKHSNITKEVVVIGEINYFTIWSPEQYANFHKQVDKTYLEDSETIDKIRRRYDENTGH